MARIFSSVDELIGNTPLVEFKELAKSRGAVARVIAKLEYLNPRGSVKDRAALYIIDGLEKSGKITDGAVIIEATSGNTGIGLAAVCAARGYRAIIVMPDSMSPERIALMRAYGAEVILTDGKLGMAGAIEKAKELNREISGSFIADQFNNTDNAKAHFETTGPELFRDTEGELDVVVIGVGTGGTLTGTAEYLKSKNKNIKIIAVEPSGSAVLSGKQSGPHGLQGIGAGFIPTILNRGLIDGVVTVTEEEAYAAANAAAKREGVLVGISSGAALHAALTLAGIEENRGKTIAVILPDGGEKYMSSHLFD